VDLFVELLTVFLPSVVKFRVGDVFWDVTPVIVLIHVMADMRDYLDTVEISDVGLFKTVDPHFLFGFLIFRRVTKLGVDFIPFGLHLSEHV
jgi:hypothetical protein